MKTKIFLFTALAAMLLAGCKDTPTADPSTYTISVTGVENGKVSVTVGGQQVDNAAAGTTITIAATPDDGYGFAGWTVAGTTPADQTAESTTFTMPEGNVTVRARFVEIESVYDIDVNDPEYGSIGATVAGERVDKAAAGTTVTITARPDTGYTLAEWMVTGATPANVTALTTTFRMPAGNVEVTARFTGEYTITVSQVEGGTASASAEKATAGTQILIDATEDEGYIFDKWTITGADPDNAKAPSTTFTMGEGNVTVTAVFIHDPVFYDDGVVINGVRWATRNVDAPGTFAATPQSTGMFYQWGRKIGWSGSDPLTSSDGSTDWDHSDYVGSSWTTESDPSPEGWRVPSWDDFNSLFDGKNVSRGWSNYPAGYEFRDVASGNTLFIPASGYRDTYGGLVSVNVHGRYWSRSPAGDSNGFLLYLYAGDMTIPDLLRRYGATVRPVAK